MSARPPSHKFEGTFARFSHGSNCRKRSLDVIIELWTALQFTGILQASLKWSDEVHLPCRLSLRARSRLVWHDTCVNFSKQFGTALNFNVN